MRILIRGQQPIVWGVAILGLALASAPVPARSAALVEVRAKPQQLSLYGSRGGTPVVVSSGDGGWVRLAPYVAGLLASRGYFVVGVNSKAYLSAFTTSTSALTEHDVRRDYRTFVEFAARESSVKPLLIGVSEGAGLSVLAATDATTRSAVKGVIGLGLGDQNELGWRWRDATIYLTKKTPNEPSFSTAGIVSGIAPLPLAALHSSRDEYVPLSEVRQVLARATGPTRLWIVQASDHRFSGSLPEFDRRLMEAIDWVNAQHIVQ